MDRLVKRDVDTSPYDSVPQFSGVYAIRNRVTGGMYIGSTINLRARWGSHSWALRRGKHSDPALQAAWDEYGEDAFELVLVEPIPRDARRGFGAHPDHLVAERKWQIDLSERGTELYNRTLPKLKTIPVVEWNSTSLIEKATKEGKKR